MDPKLWDLSTHLLQELTRIAKPLQLPAPEAAAVLLISLARFYGQASLPGTSAEDACDSVAEGLFLDGRLRGLFLEALHAERDRYH